MPVAKAAAAEATVTAPKYPSGISVEKTLEKIKLWGKGTEEGGCTDLIWYLGMGISALMYSYVHVHFVYCRFMLCKIIGAQLLGIS